MKRKPNGRIIHYVENGESRMMMVFPQSVGWQEAAILALTSGILLTPIVAAALLLEWSLG